MDYNTGKNRLLFATTSRKHAESYKRLLDAITENNIGIEIFQWGEDVAALKKLLSYKPQLILCSNYISDEQAVLYLPMEMVLKSDLDISEPENLEQLFMLPPGTDALVVTPQKKFSLQTIEMLEKYGINHINYFPYWEGCQIDAACFTFAIHTDAPEFCPVNIKKKVDIGLCNTLSPGLIIKILEFFSFDNKAKERYLERQRNNSAKVYQQLAKAHLSVWQLKSVLETITEGLDEAIISIDAAGRVTELNAAAQKISKQSRQNAIGNDVRAIFAHNPEIANIKELSSLNTLVTLGGQQLYADYLKLEDNADAVGLIRLREISSIQKKDEHIRQLMFRKNQGHFARYRFEDILCDTPVMKRLKENAEQFAKTPYTVLLTGESGTGKELFAQSIHNHSGRANNPFVAVNFAALPENLVESELFGYEEGAFTGARKTGKKGLFELAHTGTIFLDEIGDATVAVQTRLLRVLEEQVVMRVGDTKVTPVNVRVIAATNKDLKKMIAEGGFRTDLYYRLNAFQLRIPPLRERVDSIMAFIRLFSQGGFSPKDFTPAALACIKEYAWPGNLREVRNLANYISVTSKKLPIDVDDLPEDLKNQIVKTGAAADSFLLDYKRLSVRYGEEETRNTLKIIDKNNVAGSFGRAKMQELLSCACGYEVAMNRMRLLLEELKNLGFVDVGKTKQGTRLSDNGRVFLHWLEQTAMSEKNIYKKS